MNSHLAVCSFELGALSLPVSVHSILHYLQLHWCWPPVNRATIYTTSGHSCPVGAKKFAAIVNIMETYSILLLYPSTLKNNVGQKFQDFQNKNVQKSEISHFCEYC